MRLAGLEPRPNAIDQLLHGMTAISIRRSADATHQALRSMTRPEFVMPSMQRRDWNPDDFEAPPSPRMASGKLRMVPPVASDEFVFEIPVIHRRIQRHCCTLGQRASLVSALNRGI